jgi:hypothetical protein
VLPSRLGHRRGGQHILELRNASVMLVLTSRVAGLNRGRFAKILHRAGGQCAV